MTDILDHINRNMNTRPSEVTDWRATMHDARAEIERLHAENAEMRRTFGSHPLFQEKDAEIKRLQQTANETEARRRHLEDVSCRQQNEIKRLNTRITNLWYALDRVKHGAEYCDDLGDIIDRALTVVDTGDEMHQVLGEALAKGATLKPEGQS